MNNPRPLLQINLLVLRGIPYSVFTQAETDIGDSHNNDHSPLLYNIIIKAWKCSTMSHYYLLIDPTNRGLLMVMSLFETHWIFRRRRRSDTARQKQEA